MDNVEPWEHDGSIDLTGKTINRLTVIAEAQSRRCKRGDKVRYWLCSCACGNTKEIPQTSLTHKKNPAQGCGCRKGKNKITHGKSKSREYSTWRGILERCYNKNNPSYKRYGGKGITMCENWKNSFESFLQDMGEKPPRSSIERIDNTKGYFPENCKWATAVEQARNRSDNYIVTYEDKEMCLSELAEVTGLCREKLKYQIQKKGLTAKQAVQSISSNIEPWEFPGGSIWKSKSAYFSWVRGQIRRGLWSRNPIKNYIKREAARPAPKGMRAKKVIQCEFCLKDHAQSKIEVDHIIPAGSLKDWDDIGGFMQRMLNPSGGYRLLCKPCHKTHTYAEKHNISFEEAQAHKEAIRVIKLPAKKQVEYMKRHGFWTEENSINSYKRRIAIIEHLKNK